MSLPVALTLGDPAGIGLELALKAWTALRDHLPFFLIGDTDHMAALGARLGVPVRAIDAPAAAAALPEGLPVLPHALPRPAPPLGLVFVRTSPDHGTAYDIAGDLRANPANLIAALELARAMAESRARRQ